MGKMHYNNGTNDKKSCLVVLRTIKHNVWKFKILVKIINIGHTEVDVINVTAATMLIIIIRYEVLKKNVISSSSYCI